VRTNIDIDDGLMAAAQEATGLPTKRAVVEEGLHTLVRLREQQGIRALRGRIGFVEEPPEEGIGQQASRVGSVPSSRSVVPERPGAGAQGAKRVAATGRFVRVKERAPRAKGEEGAAGDGAAGRRR
jgi:hypothetical protein